MIPCLIEFDLQILFGHLRITIDFVTGGGKVPTLPGPAPAYLRGINIKSLRGRKK